MIYLAMYTITMLLATAGAYRVFDGHDEAARYEPTIHLDTDSGIEWTYSRTSDVGVHHWGEANPVCGGIQQSPIDIRSAVYNSSLSPLRINWKKWPKRLMANIGHSIQVNEQNDVESSTIVGGPLHGMYRAIQFHVHATSEHTLEGGSYPLELHVVHQNMDPIHQKTDDPLELAVVGIFFKEGKHNAAFASFFDNLRFVRFKDNTTKVDIDLPSLLPKSIDYFTYPGSLTTPNGMPSAPGCRETVTWIVLKDALEISGEQIEKLRDVMHLEINNRPTQPLNGRTIQTNIPPVASCDGTESTFSTMAGSVAVNVANFLSVLKFT